MDDELQKLAVYLPFIASILCFFLSKRLYFYFRRHLRKWDLNPVRRRLLYKIVTRRFDGSSNLSLFLLIVILVLAALNAFALFFKNATKGGISQRSASLSQLNLMILCFGSSLSFLNEKFFGFNLRTLAPLHYWIGRMYLVHLSLHGFIQLSLQHWTLPSIPALLGISLAFILVLVPTLWIRRRFYEFVVATHSILSYVYVTILWFHIPFKQRYYLITLITASSLLVLQKLFQVSALYFRNRSFSAVNSTSIKRFDSIACLKIWPELPWKYRPGHYIYLRDPRVPKWAGLVLTRFQSHPYQIAWYSNEKGGEKVVKVYLLVQSWRGFSKWLNKATISSKINPSSPYDELELNSYKSRKETEIPGSSGNLTARQYENFPCVQIQGPYGSLQPEQYEKLVLLSNGIGIASHLAVAKYLIEVGNQNLTRRIDLVWYSQSIEQSILVKKYFKKLISLDAVRAKKLCIYFQDRFDIINVGNLDGPTDYISLKRIEEPTVGGGLGGLFEDFRNIEAGNALIMVCGSPTFEEEVRIALLQWPKNEPYRLVYGDFQPDGMQGER